MEKQRGNKGGKNKHGDYSKFYKKPPLKANKQVEKKKKEKPVLRPKLTSPFGKDGTMRLNKFIAHAGVCSRREADVLIASGVIKVNGKTVTELGFKVSAKDKVSLSGQQLRAETLRYVLLNKPRGFITTTDDPYERKTVMSLVEKACKERIYPVGRLDRDTTGLLLFTNDGDLAKKLTHPKHQIRKIYHVFLDKEVTKNHLLQLVEGVQLDDGSVAADKASYVEGNKHEIGLELHSGKNRVVRRMFEALGYQVVKLDRVVFAGLTKKDLPRGKWRHLSPKEINFLKMKPT